MFGIYIHVPFCAKICDYCDFRVMPANARLFEEYTGLLEREIRAFAAAHPVSHSASPQNVLSQARTLYLGGGTPSILPGACLERIFAVLEECGVRVDSLDEVSMEFNPESCTEESVQTALSCGVRRFSLGLQTFSQPLLDRIGRRHTVERGFEALRLLTSLPQVKVSGDLMFDLPGQSVDSFLSDVDRLSDFPLGHLSFYGLNVGERTLLGGRVSRGEEKIDESLYEPMYLGGVEILEKKGFARYEVSNFAKPGDESLHNMNYWNRGEYIGFGPGAHSYFAGRRFCAPEIYPRWRDYVNAGSPDASLTYDDLDKDDILTERVWLSLRQRSGLDLNALAADGILISPEGYEPWVKKGFATLEGGILKLVGRGWIFMDSIVTDVLNACR
ncbi:MAG: coproporphyrinogen III oxidase family protein [Fibrobacter sp.]|uniref:coproporphyrinogen-III oxidase family protein n=1 Tax=Fibrobacter sp. TaxID=35828 RepID=UPI0025BAB505|nr:coproporphyrinogen-III oxidase family protein [Fibrobacter sp.]MBQ7080713.1 coproporphyrinogen III oxidase family protein [Fibrobacter sp.]